MSPYDEMNVDKLGEELVTGVRRLAEISLVLSNRCQVAESSNQQLVMDLVLIAATLGVPADKEAVLARLRQLLQIEKDFKSAQPT